MQPTYRCLQCLDGRYVCANHPAVAWDEGEGCPCGAEGVPCPNCNSGMPAEDPPWGEVIARRERYTQDR